MAEASIISEYSQHLVLGFLGLAAAALLYITTSSPLAKVPGPWYARFTKEVFKYHEVRGSQHKYIQALHQKYGPVVLLAPDHVDVTDLSAVKEIYTVKATYVKPAEFYARFGPPGRENIFNTADVQLHRRLRKILSGGFSKSALESFHPIIEHRVKMMIARVAEEMKARGAADVFKWWIFMGTDVIGELTFGESFRMLEQGKKNEYIISLEKAAKVGGKRRAYPLLAKLSSYGVPIPGFQGAAQLRQNMVRYATESLERCRRLVESNPESPIPTLFTKLFQGEGDETMTPEELLNSAQVYIFGGTDTTAVTMTYLVWQLCRNPDVRERLVEELKQLPEDFRDSDCQGLPYLNQVIDETLRLHGAAPAILPRTVPQGGATLGGHYLPGGSIVSTQAWTLHRNPDVFPDPDRFDPSRWAAATKEMKDSFMPFGGGSRICIGLHLARLELRLATAHFFRAFPNVKQSALEGMSDDDMEQLVFFLAPPKGKRCLIECSQ